MSSIGGWASGGDLAMWGIRILAQKGSGSVSCTGENEKLQAEHWISAVRDKALHLACLRRGLDGWYGRDFDRLPAEVLALIREGLVRSLDAEELRRPLEVVVAALLRESTEVSDMAAKLEGQLYELASLQAGT